MSDAKPIRVLIADDHPVVRAGLALMLKYEVDMEPVAQAANGREAVEMYAECRPDVVLMDLRMPEMDGVEAIEAIRSRHPQARIILLTTYETDEGIFRALRAGARAYLVKDAPCEEILDTVRAVHAGERRITATVGVKLAERAEYPELTERELDVLRALVKGKTNAEISAELFIAEGTVKFHVNHILAKLDVADRTHAVIVALRRGLATLD
ncbi:MAG: response regulator transcription factor [Armatimonadetes bacterium]|nr:response regulator transcription factor [Armatimonadota bacterium]